MKQPPIGDCHRRCVVKALAPIIEPHVQAGACPIAAPYVHQHGPLLLDFRLLDHIRPQYGQHAFSDCSWHTYDVPARNSGHPLAFNSDVTETAARQYAGSF